MDFFAFLWMFGLTVIMPITLTFMSINHKREIRRLKEAAYHAAPESVVTRAELKDLLLDVAEEASAPLYDRIEAMERTYGVSHPPESTRTIGRIG